MRCPKCGFISFDHLTSCAKCGKDIAEVASELQGTSIKVETPMFLSTTLASYADREHSFEEHAMDAEIEEGIDFSMDEGPAVEEVPEIAGTKEAIDFSFGEDEAEADITLAEPKEEEAKETGGAAYFALETEAEEEAAPEKTGKTFEDLDFAGVTDDEEEGGLEFDLEDFLEDMDDDKSKPSTSVDIDLDLDDEEK